MSVYVKPKQIIVAGLRARIWGKETDTNYCFEFLLKGSSKDRRRQVREIYRTYPDCRITRSAPIVLKTMSGDRVEVEDANTPQSTIRGMQKLQSLWNMFIDNFSIRAPGRWSATSVTKGTYYYGA